MCNVPNVLFTLTTNSGAVKFMQYSVGGMADIGRDPCFQENLVYSVTRHNVYGVRLYFMHI